jgi:hypothetical protein
LFVFRELRLPVIGIPETDLSMQAAGIIVPAALKNNRQESATPALLIIAWFGLKGNNGHYRL